MGKALTVLTAADSTLFSVSYVISDSTMSNSQKMLGKIARGNSRRAAQGVHLEQTYHTAG
jgi:hypothetical protein